MRVPKFSTLILAAFAAAPAIALPEWLMYLRAHRPLTTTVNSDYILPRISEGVTYYISEQDRLIVLGLSLWLVLAAVALVFLGFRIFRRPLMRMLRPPEDMRPVKKASNTTDAHA